MNILAKSKWSSYSPTWSSESVQGYGFTSSVSETLSAVSKYSFIESVKIYFVKSKGNSPNSLDLLKIFSFLFLASMVVYY